MSAASADLGVDLRRPSLALGAAAIAWAIYVTFPAIPEPVFWLDEAWRALMIRDTSTFGQILAYSSAYGFWTLPSEWVLGKVGLFLFGERELAFRVWPLLGFTSALIGAFVLFRRQGFHIGAVCVVCLIGFGPRFLIHAREFKPYAIDLALTIWTIVSCLHGAREAMRARVSIGFILMSSLLATGTIIFAFAFPAIALFRILRLRKPLAVSALELGVPMAVFTVMIWLWFLPQPTSSLTEYWRDHYLTSPAAIPRVLSLFMHDVRAFYPLPAWLLGAALMFSIAPSIARRDWMFVLILVPLAPMVLASVLRVYPLFGRPSYFFYGLMAIGVARSGDWIGYWILSRRRRIVAAGLAAAVGAAAFLMLGGRERLLRRLEMTRAYPPDQGGRIFAVLDAHWRPGDRVIVNYGFVNSFLFHRARFATRHPDAFNSDDPILHAVVDRSNDTLCRSLNRLQPRDLAGATRVWFLSTHVNHAWQYYHALLPALGTLETYIKEKEQTAIRLTLDGEPKSLACP